MMNPTGSGNLMECTIVHYRHMVAEVSRSFVISAVVTMIGSASITSAVPCKMQNARLTTSSAPVRTFLLAVDSKLVYA